MQVTLGLLSMSYGTRAYWIGELSRSLDRREISLAPGSPVPTAPCTAQGPDRGAVSSR